MGSNDKLRHKVEQQAKRMQQAESEQDSLVAQTIYLGTLALLFVLPVIGGAYLGNWLDNMDAGYSYKWTVGLIALGIGVGIFNVYMFVREHE
ncbi:AtpZ/AtpI family protein [Sulfurirhabdus autotrophica]|uniref:ATP synthase protein I n=1 Tax=Sulfurirhabdus autotrophica TaxID=1706046 RepID=A0A4V2W321_9PROT|nr:AtpZ/AtpI family protein [Sulfurirhabdus autotrophica]TCV90269.1 ATP synthase protein I [Sulfurirhabdus autotrophica]